MPYARTLASTSKRNAETNTRADIYARITDQIVKAIEAGAGEFNMPWHMPAASSAMPCNAATGNQYRGVNVLALWAEAHLRRYPEAEWATYQQWSALGLQVRKGEKATTGVFWRSLDRDSASDSREEPQGEIDLSRPRCVARAFSLFNIAQTEGYVPPNLPPRPDHERIAHAEAFMAALGANIRHGGHRAFYRSASDFIQMPPFEVFADPLAYYSTLAHEATHWTGHKSRLDRDLGNRFGSESYAAEELIAELGAAFIAADLGLSLEPKQENAAYIDTWLTVLKRDTRAIFTASSHAQRAADYLHGLQASIAPQPLVQDSARVIQQSLCL